MTLSDAKLYVARVAGAHNDTAKLALAADAIKATAQKWSNKHNWEWARKDNANTRSLAVTVTASPSCTVVSTAGLNVGQAFTLNSTPYTILSITSLTAFVASAAVATGTAVFAAYIPVIAGTSYYYLPSDFKDFYSTRLLTSKRPLTIIRDRETDRTMVDQESRTIAIGITLASPGSGSGFSAADQRPRARIVGVPDTSEDMLVRYYRTIDGAADPVDFPDDYIYAFLDDAKVWFLSQLNSNDPRIDILGGLANRNLDDVISTDENIDDEDVCMKSQMDVFSLGMTTRGYPLGIQGE